MIPASSIMAFAEKSCHHDVALLDIEHLVPAEQRNLNNPQTALTESGFMDTLKDTRVTSRVRSDLKKKLALVAASGGKKRRPDLRHISTGGIGFYGKEGARYMRRFLARRNDQSRDGWQGRGLMS